MSEDGKKYLTNSTKLLFETEEDIEICGLTIPKGMILVVNQNSNKILEILKPKKALKKYPILHSLREKINNGN